MTFASFTKYLLGGNLYWGGSLVLDAGWPGQLYLRFFLREVAQIRVGVSGVSHGCELFVCSLVACDFRRIWSGIRFFVDVPPMGGVRQMGLG